jgi:ribosomal-protein-alanine N-acetyltransferase
VVAVPPGVRFTPMEVGDLAPMLAIERASFPSPWTAGLFLQELDVPFSRVIVARADDAAAPEILGYLCRWIVVDEVHVMNVAVAPHYRRRGLASALVREVVREGTAHGLAAVTLEVRRGNGAARGLYEALGFEEVGVRAGYYARREDALIMRRALADE